MAQATEARRETKTLVRYEGIDGVAVLTLDDPPANTYTYEMMRQLDEAILRARMDDDVSVIVLTLAVLETLMARWFSHAYVAEGVVVVLTGRDGDPAAVPPEGEVRQRELAVESLLIGLLETLTAKAPVRAN